MAIGQEKKDKIFFIIPAYNEAEKIAEVLSSLIKHNYNNLVVIDDGSTDSTPDIVDKFIQNGVIFLRHSINRGQGAALKTGIIHALTYSSCNYVCTFDSDGQHTISDLENFINVLDTGMFDIALGSRFLDINSIKMLPLKKRILLRVATQFSKLHTGLSLTDTHNGFRVMNKKAAREIDITMDRYEHASEILNEIAEKKIRYTEMPSLIKYTPYSIEKGQKMANAFKIISKVVLNSFK